MDTGKNILIIQTAFIGDVILTTPLVEVLAKEFSGVIIDFLTIPKVRDKVVAIFSTTLLKLLE